MEAKKEIESHLSRLQKDIQTQSDYLSKLLNEIKGMKQAIKSTEKNIFTLDGAIQAYRESARLLEDGNLIKQALEGEVIAN